MFDKIIISVIFGCMENTVTYSIPHVPADLVGKMKAIASTRGMKLYAIWIEAAKAYVERNEKRA